LERDGDDEEDDDPACAADEAADGHEEGGEPCEEHPGAGAGCHGRSILSG